MSVLGRIHSFESCGTVDGPGIRFILFMQGCLMRCKYCHNRDTWDLEGGKEISVEDLMKEVVTYRHFMNATGGGVTASGGEAVLQAEFVRDWFRACKAEGINTCLDTNGFVRHYDHIIDELLDVTDLVLLDLKELNDQVHQNLIGVPNKRTLEFAKYLQPDSAIVLTEKTKAIITFALCGFANFSSIAILIGGLGGMAPNRRSDVARLGLKAVIAGTLANLMSATIAGLFIGLGAAAL